MVKLENKTVGIAVSDNGDELVTYSLLLHKCIGAVPSSGMTISQQRTMFSLLDSFEQANGFIEIDEKNVQFIKDSVINYPWQIAHRDLLTFEDDIKAL